MIAPLKIFFIINPVAGGYKKKCDKYIADFFLSTGDEIKIEHTKSKGDGTLLARKALAAGYNIVVAAGGDGTVNEVALELINTDATLGIIPMGSGNGLARHHKIPVNFSKALSVIKRNNQTTHDAIKINQYISFNVSGIGFDARVAHSFGEDGQRGLTGYAKLVLKEFKNTPEFEFEIISGNTKKNYRAMMLSIANSTQFGNNAIIAPTAITNDGLANITIVRKMPLWKLPSFAMSVFNSTVGNSPYAILLEGDSFEIKCNEKLPLHIDGEAAGYDNHFSIQIQKNVLNLIIP